MHRGGLLSVGRQRLFIFDLEEKIMLITPEEKKKIRRNLLKIAEALTEIEKILIDATILGIPDSAEDPEIEHVGYDEEQCARNTSKDSRRAASRMP